MKEIFISKKKEKTIIVLVENGNIIEKYEEVEGQKRLEGSIYLGKAQNVLQGMQAAFVDIGENKNAFIHLKDILPKIDEKKYNLEEHVEKNNIKDVIKQGKLILIQVKRDATNKKGARVSTHISLPSRFLVFMPDTEFITISQKIEDNNERERLISIVKAALPNNCGAIIRTSAEGKEEKEIKEDIEKVIKQWNEIQSKIDENKNNAPILIYQNDGLVKKFLIDMMDKKIDKIVVDDSKILAIVKEFFQIKSTEISLKTGGNILEVYQIEEQLKKLNNRKIWLKCGGFITIDKTEALTAIDVNSGKYIGNDNLEKTVFTVNKEASIEIANQLKLRDIDGIIIIDYIDMKEEKNKEKIIEVLQENFKKDRSKTQVVGFSKLNLLEMTRKHIYSND